MTFCQTCGAVFADGATFCPACAVRPRSTSGLSTNATGALAYLAGIVTGILFLVIEPCKCDRVVRFHAFQSIFFNVAWIALWVAWILAGLVLGVVTKGIFFVLQAPIDLLLMVGGFALWAYLMFSAYQGKTIRLPFIGTLAARQAGL